MATGTLIFLIVVCLWNYIAGERTRVVYQTKDSNNLVPKQEFLALLLALTSMAWLHCLFDPTESMEKKAGVTFLVWLCTVVMGLMLLVGISCFGINILWIFGAFALGFGRRYVFKFLPRVLAKIGAGAGFVWDKLMFWRKGYRGVRRRTLAALKKLERVLEGSLCQQSLLEARRLYDNVLPSLQRQIERINVVLAMNISKIVEPGTEYHRRAVAGEERLRALRVEAIARCREIPNLVASWVPAAALAVACEQTAPAEALIAEQAARMDENLRAIETQVREVEDERDVLVEV